MANAGLARFDATAGPLFVAAGMGDPATFQRAPADAIAMSVVYLDEDVQAFGIDSQVQQNIRTVRLFKRYGIPRPKRGDLVTLNTATTPEPFQVDGGLVREDASSYVCTIVPVSA
jgi:hypothetical protein